MAGAKATARGLFARYCGGGRVFMLVLGLGLGGTVAACGGEESPPPELARPFFSQPTDGTVVPPSFQMILGIDGLVVEPAGEAREGAGHFHILIDSDFIPAGEVVPDDEQHLHLDDGATEAEITLAPGPHILLLQFADGNNRALESDHRQLDQIVVTVTEDAPAQSVRFVYPTDGAIVPPTFEVRMAATGMVVGLTEEIQEDAGAFHILVDTDFVPAGGVIPSDEGDEQHIHLDDGSRITSLSLSPGSHTLRLQFADNLDTASRGDQFRDEITIIVGFGRGAQQVMFVEPAGGATVSPTFTVKTAAVGLFVEPAITGSVIEGLIRELAGHLHILVDEAFVLQVITEDETHIHLEGGELSTELTLQPGTHTLRLQMADHINQALEGNQFRDEIIITVE